ncbi:MAG TPA: extracellular solute-binding protein [Nitrososphaerales archaeon]|nr:extracellular solute-binding protein [Nitrososphaerales archaeon]
MPERVIIYASLGLRSGTSDLLWAFRKKNTLEEFPVYLDDHPFQVRDRIREEMKHGMRTADIVMVPHYVALQMHEEGLFTPHDAKDVGAYPQKFYDRKLNWFAAGVTFMTMAHNPKRLPAKDLPESLEEIASTRWKGRLGMQSLTSSRFGNIGAHYMNFLRRNVSGKKWTDFLESLAGPNKPLTYDCIDHLLQGLIDGDHDLSLTVYSLAYFRERTVGSPVRSFETEHIPRMLTFTTAALLRTAKDNKSARKFLDFLLGEEGQKLIGRITGISPSMPGQKAGYPFEVEYSPKDVFHPDAEDLASLPATLAIFSKLKLP